MDLTTKTRAELIALCKERGVRGYSGKSKEEMIRLLTPSPSGTVITHVETSGAGPLRTIDLFAGTGAFTLAFQGTGRARCVFANDMVPASKSAYDLNQASGHVLTLQNLHDVATELIPAHDLLTGGFPCFVAGTLVLTQKGYKAIETVDLTDTLFTHTGKFQPILNKQVKSSCSFVHSITIQYHPHAIECTEEHPMYARERIRVWNKDIKRYQYAFSDPKWIPAKQLTDEHFTGLPIDSNAIIPVRTITQSINSTISREITTTLNDPNHWFMMGYFLGDGWIEETVKPSGKLKYIIRFAINNADETYVKSRITKVMPITDKKCSTGLCKKFGCSNEFWYTILKDFGKYSHGKCIPEWVQKAPKEYIEEFLFGYQTADGCINKSSRGIEDHHIQYTTVSPNIAYGIQRLYLKIGKLCSISYHKMPSTCEIEGRKVNQRNTYKLRITTNRQRVSSSFFDENYSWFKIRSNTIKHIEPQMVYNFEVDTDNSYCVENTIVHNCQPFSIAGKREGFEDKRSNVFWKILDILDHHQPACVVLENVKNLVTHDEGRTFETITTNLKDRGYHLCYKVLNTAKITGVPQHRERIYIVGLRSKEAFDRFSLDFPDLPKRSVAEFLDCEVPAKYYYGPTSAAWDLLRGHVVKRNTIYQYRRVYVRENKSQECPTLTANMGGGGHNVPIILDDRGIRKLTPRECFRFQGFPDTYKLPPLSDSHLYKLAGNAVSVPVVRLIAERLVRLIAEAS